ncbi:hypothetical protein ASPWEDRAFT_113322 [Aspergillus wentii DTO 134E9]|uniref:Major facilitator superfamily (MFS) profile domain-containing protein n=1 Tax=Aspergillus wentii DTO 134E9 TaxID=1073089 RepID=A0A1L9RIA6_ASPWE|nr:uncharacterized protein ASPWEDRAFT_113322 [Aspergillus wentii DTO 134E9]OJJ34603.1 hypothetical protein ASPWEDRAFT_113322 [Aspergillus wentii DTO 134E9]
MGAGREFPPLLSDSDQYLVDFDGPDDTSHPRNWSLPAKIYTSCLACIGTFVATFTSGIFAAGIPGVSNEFNVSEVVGNLGTTLFVLGFASGPLLWAPASELFGRRWPLTIGMLGTAIFTISSAVAKDVQTLIICRFFAGMFGASQLSVVPGVIADLYNTADRGIVLSLYSLTVFCGPFSAPFIGGFTAMSSLGWRWTLYIPSFIAFLNGTLDLLYLKETYAPCLLAEKAVHIRRQSGNWAIHAKQEEIEFDIHELIRKNFTLPIQMLITEPIVFLLSLYMSFIYSLAYALLEAYPYVFQEIYHMNLGVSGLPFIGLIVGQVLGCVYILSQHNSYVKKLDANPGISNPELRLPPATLGAPVFTAGVFWFGWTGFTSSVHWMAPTAAGVLVGFGIFCIFVPCFSYLVDAYLPLAASTVAGHIILRSTIAASFPLFTRQMFHNLGVEWAGTLLGCIALVMIPIPVVFRRYGPWFRSKSKLAP